MLDVSLLVLQALTVALTIGAVAIWAVVLKETISLFLESFGLKKTAVVAIMALVLLSGATTYAGEVVVQIEDGNLVYYEKTKIKVAPDVPKGITAEQAQLLVEGKIPVVSFSKEEERVYWGLPLTKRTETSVSFRDGWIKDEKSGDESLSVIPMIILVLLMICCFVGARRYFRKDPLGVGELAVGMVIFFLYSLPPLLMANISGGKALLQTGYTMMIWAFVGWSSSGLSLLYLRRRREKRKNAVHGITAETI